MILQQGVLLLFRPILGDMEFVTTTEVRIAHRRGRENLARGWLVENRCQQLDAGQPA